MSAESEVNFDDRDEFFFESDHLALKENKDYKILLKTILTLEVQRNQGIEDMEKLHKIQQDALEDPISFVEKLSKGESIGIPPPIKLQEVPKIDWSKYHHVMPEEINRPLTRTKIMETRDSFEDGTSDDGSKVKIRGRPYDDSKPETFNQLWTPEEQKRLEELLVEYPVEQVESHRWKKIANALGNRTATQVQSRVQKYFKKLHLAGLPIPGRIPKYNLDMIKKGHRHQRNNHLLLKPSTFFPAFDPPVHMTDEMDGSISKFNFSNEEQVPSQKPVLAHQKKFQSNISISASNHSELIQLIIRDKNDETSQGSHTGYSCDGCGEDPLKGTRWHCNECGINNVSYDLCSDCLASYVFHETGVQSEETSAVYHPSQHTIYHHFTPVYLRASVSSSSISSWDPDYLASSSSYNYLDPNFMPE